MTSVAEDTVAGGSGPAGAPDPLVELRGISKTYGGAHALANVHLKLFPGETVGLVGKNGAGKSTLIKVLAGAVTPDAGSNLMVKGAPVFLRGPRDAGRHGFAFVHQDLSLGLAPNLTVAENVALGLGYPRSMGVLYDRRRLCERAEEVLAQLGVALDVRAPVGGLSVVQQRMVTIGRALSQQANLIVMDEPTVSLTPAEMDHLYAVVDRLHGNGVAVIYVSHRLAEVFRLSQRLVVMRNGTVVHDAPADSVDEPSLIRHITGVVHHSPAGHRRARTAGAEVLRVERLSVLPRVADVSFALHAGEVLGLAGLVGSGRSETVRAIFGAETRAGGRVFVHGEEAAVSSPRHALRKRVVLLPENRAHQGMVSDFSIRANITLPTLSRHRSARLGRFPVPSRSRERDTATSFMKRLNIKAAGHEQRASALSGGNQQKVIVGKWLHHGADVFMFDEPTQGIDVQGKEEIYQIMKELATVGAGVIFISSEFVELERVCDRVLVMREGCIVSELTESEISEEKILESCFTTAIETGRGDTAAHAV